jgi:L-xylulokinase
VGHSYLVGLDVGGSYVKATAFDLDRSVAVTRGKAVPVLHPAPGHNERDARVIWHAVAEVVHQVMDALPADRQVEAVGITGHGNGLYLVDHKGRPTRNAVMASDTRAADQVRNWIDAGVQDRLAPLTWNRLWPGQPGPVLAWLRENEPDAVTDASYALQCKDFIRAQLVGQISTELTDLSCSGLYDNSRDELSAEVFEALDIPDLKHLVPAPVSSADVVGHVTREAAELTGIPHGTLVVAGVVDNVALHFGSDVLDGSAICVAAGTWSVNQLLVSREEMLRRSWSGPGVPFAACSNVLPGTALLIEASPTSASTLAWALEQVLRGVGHEAEAAGTDVFEFALRRVAALPPKRDEPLFVPYLDGSRDNPAARGGWVNVSSWNDEDALLGAVVEGVCMEHRRHIERLSPTSAGLPLRLSGGAAKSATWAQRFADITARAVEVSGSQELGVVGAAAVAGVGVGVLKDFASAVTPLLEPGRVVFTPDADSVDHYEERYSRYVATADWMEQMPTAQELRHGAH